MEFKMNNSKITIPKILKMKKNKQIITMLTAYDATFAKLLDNCGVDILLVGDSLGMVIQGRENTLKVTLDQMIYHCSNVTRVCKKSHVVGDMPFMSYQVSVKHAVKNAGKLVQSGGVESVKLEGGTVYSDRIKAIVETGIPVMGHIGLTPQSIHKFGGYKIQGKKSDAAEFLKEDALAVENAGAYSVVLEGIPASLATEISKMLKIPTIGISAGENCDGQVLVIYDLLGMDPDFNPKFLKKYADLSKIITESVNSYLEEVKSKEYPSKRYSF